MSKRQTLFADPKITTKHQTVIEDAVPILDRARKLDEVEKIVVGPIDPNKSSTPRVKTNEVPAGLLLKIQGTESLQRFWIYTKKPAHVKADIHW